MDSWPRSQSPLRICLPFTSNSSPSNRKTWPIMPDTSNIRKRLRTSILWSKLRNWRWKAWTLWLENSTSRWSNLRTLCSWSTSRPCLWTSRSRSPRCRSTSVRRRRSIRRNWRRVPRTCRRTFRLRWPRWTRVYWCWTIFRGRSRAFRWRWRTLLRSRAG